jgi:hypothetical protein
MLIVSRKLYNLYEYKRSILTKMYDKTVTAQNVGCGDCNK